MCILESSKEESQYLHNLDYVFTLEDVKSKKQFVLLHISKKLWNFPTNWQSKWSAKLLYYLQVTSVKKQEILSHLKNISSNQLSSNLFSKTVTFTKFLQKMYEKEFP